MKISLSFLFLLLSFSIYSNTLYLSDMRQAGLPDKIQGFLNKHFGNYEIEKLKYDAEDGECKVKYKNGIKIKFDRNGDWEQIERDYFPLPKSIIDILPASTIQYIAKKYPRKPIVEIKRKSYGYRLKLENSLELKFDHYGNILKIDD